MPSPTHETIVRALCDEPALLALLSKRLLGAGPDPSLRADESNLRAAPALEVRPDGVFLARRPPWLILEVQRRVDRGKRRRWPLAAAILLNQRGVMGEVLILTTSARVAGWAARAASLRGPLGIWLLLKPVVLLITANHADSLLDPHYPKLALFAAWSVHRRHGPQARHIVQRAVKPVLRLPSRLRAKWMRAIVNVLSSRMFLFVREWLMDFSRIPEKPWVREFFQELEAVGEVRGEARGKAKGEATGELRGRRTAVLEVLAARGLHVSDAQRRRIERCADREVLRQWLARAAVAGSTREVLAIGSMSRLAAKPVAPRKRKD